MNKSVTCLFSSISRYFFLKTHFEIDLISICIRPMMERLHHLYHFLWFARLPAESRQWLVLVLVCCIISIICFGLDGPIQSDHGWIGSQTSNLRKLNFEFTLSKLGWAKRVEVWKWANDAWQKYIFYNFTGINVTRTGNLENNLNGIFYYHHFE